MGWIFLQESQVEVLIPKEMVSHTGHLCLIMGCCCACPASWLGGSDHTWFTWEAQALRSLLRGVAQHTRGMETAAGPEARGKEAPGS